MKSLSELMHEAYRLSLHIAYSERNHEDHYFTPRDISEEDDALPNFSVWGWVDGLIHKMYHKHANGECSLQAMIDFDVGDFERRVIEDIEVLRERGKNFTQVKLTKAVMRERGYTVA
jgi:hypothetical protein